jgi:hypothetical protein
VTWCVANRFFESRPSGVQRGTQITPDDRQVLVNKDVGSERWAITRNIVDSTATGNIFTSPDADPQFVYCAPERFSQSFHCVGATPCASSGTGRIRTPDGKRILVNKDINGERWAISKNVESGTLTGNVFVAGSSAPVRVLRPARWRSLPLFGIGPPHVRRVRSAMVLRPGGVAPVRLRRRDAAAGALMPG